MQHKCKLIFLNDKENGGESMTDHGWMFGTGSPIEHAFAQKVADLSYISIVHLSKDENVIIIEFGHSSNVDFNDLLMLLRKNNIHDIKIIFGGPKFLGKQENNKL
jgi:hypothetical protein